ncbi:MAG: hypothetical protein LBR46_00975 [Prevotella sp.]|nr:hypothetical protein [Prevotella sp.]
MSKHLFRLYTVSPMWASLSAAVTPSISPVVISVGLVRITRGSSNPLVAVVLSVFGSFGSNSFRSSSAPLLGETFEPIVTCP